MINPGGLINVLNAANAANEMRLSDDLSSEFYDDDRFFNKKFWSALTFLCITMVTGFLTDLALDAFLNPSPYTTIGLIDYSMLVFTLALWVLWIVLLISRIKFLVKWIVKKRRKCNSKKTANVEEESYIGKEDSPYQDTVEAIWVTRRYSDGRVVRRYIIKDKVVKEFIIK